MADARLFEQLPCTLATTHFDGLGERYQGKVKIAKVDIDQEPDLAGRFRIRGVPTMIFFKDGKVVDQVVGLLPPAQLDAKLAALSEG